MDPLWTEPHRKGTGAERLGWSRGCAGEMEPGTVPGEELPAPTEESVSMFGGRAKEALELKATLGRAKRQGHTGCPVHASKRPPSRV